MQKNQGGGKTRRTDGVNAAEEMMLARDAAQRGMGTIPEPVKESIKTVSEELETKKDTVKKNVFKKQFNDVGGRDRNIVRGNTVNRGEVPENALGGITNMQN